ncbi:MAG: ribonuclease HII [Spirochaetes bacterium]|nr:MAG: ribonuclease HII [Spirochaetota bacterium]
MRSSRTCEKPSFEIEHELLRQGCRLIAGIDEAGRGALAGPLCVGLVVFDCSLFHDIPPELSAINDSKKLTPRARRALRDVIRRHAYAQRTIMISPSLVDSLNVNGATERALDRLLKKLDPMPDAVIMDGNFRFSPGVRFIPVIRGDSRSISIAAASIAAKVDRDLVMEKYDLRYPGYLLRKNKGYGTPDHMDALGARGPSPIHRRSFEPVKSMLHPPAFISDEN